MGNYRVMIAEMKSELLDLLVTDEGEKTYLQWFEAVKPKLEYYFELKQLDFLIYSSSRECFESVQNYTSTFGEDKSIQANLITNHIRNEFTLHAFTENGFEYVDDYLVFYDEESNPLAALLIGSTKDWRRFSKSHYLADFEKAISSFIESVKKLRVLRSEEKKFRSLFNVTEFFNSTMESQVILDGIMQKIFEVFPTIDVELLLSQDQEGMTYGYKIFDYTNERSSTVDAFLAGRVTVENATHLPATLINVPIKGRQGTYGLLQIKNEKRSKYSFTQRHFVKMLASTAGSALENASLYDQSHRLIEDLRLVNETSHKLNSGLQFGEMISYLKQQLISALGPREVGFVFFGENEDYEILEASTDLFKTSEGEYYIQYVDAHLKQGKLALFDANLVDEKGELAHYKAIIAMPFLSQEETIGFIICLHQEEYFFSFDDFKLMQSLIGHSSLAISNLLLRNQLRELAEKDYLTGLYARRYLDDVVETSIDKGLGGALLLLDIDDFKKVNDTYGHDIGDCVLKQISAFILKEIQGKGGIAARWGGEEIAIYLTKVDEDLAGSFAENLIANIPLFTTPSVTVSAGMTNWSFQEKVSPKTLFKYTDTALYEAKRRGKNRLVIHDENKIVE